MPDPTWEALLPDIIGTTGGPRLVTVDSFTGRGAVLLEAGRRLGAEGIVSKRAGSPYRGGKGHNWLKTKISEEGAFVITGYIEREALAVAELRGGVLVPAGLVKFGLAGKELWQRSTDCVPGRQPALHGSGAARAVAEVKVLWALPPRLDSRRGSALGRLTSELRKRRAEYIRIENCGNDRERCEPKQ